MSPAAPVLLAGSSIFRDWGLEPAFSSSELSADRPVVNAAIGGTQTVDWLPTLGPLVAEVRPAVLCLYVGSNDLANGKHADELLRNLHRLFDNALAACPHTRLRYASILRSAHQEERFADLDRVNRAAAADLAGRERSGFVDLNPLFHRGGRLEGHLFLDDRVHLRPEAYRRMLAAMQPVVRDAAAGI